MPQFSLRRSVGRATIGLTLVAALAAPLATASQGAQEEAGGRQQAATQQEQRLDPDQRAGGGLRVPDGDGSDGRVGATLLLTPSRLSVERGARVRLTLSVLGAQDLRRVPVTVRFDSAVLELAALRLGSAWDEGSEPVLLNDASRPGEVIIGLGLLDPDAAGVTGSAELLELDFYAVGTGDGELRLERFAIIGNGSKPQPVTALTAEIIVR